MYQSGNSRCWRRSGGTQAAHRASRRTVASFHRPDIVPSKDGNGLFDAVVIGSGNRADPLDKGGSAYNFTYMIKDRHTSVGSGVDTGLRLMSTLVTLQATVCKRQVDVSSTWLMAGASGSKIRVRRFWRQR